MRVVRGAAARDAAEWLRGRIGAWATVGGVAGTGFEAYARVLHPVRAHRLSWEDPGTGMVPRVVDEREWAWSEVAQAVGGVMHPLVQWRRFSDGNGMVTLADGWEIGQTAEGRLDPAAWSSLVPHLAAAGAPDVTLGIWSGWGELQSGSGRMMAVETVGADDASPGSYVSVPDPRRIAPDVHAVFAFGDLLEVPGLKGTGRQYLVLEGPLADLTDPDWGFDVGIGWWGAFREPMPQYAWPSDHAWVVASEIDWDSTIVAGSRALVDAVLADPAFEAFEVGPGDRLDWDGDLVNPRR